MHAIRTWNAIEAMVLQACRPYYTLQILIQAVAMTPGTTIETELCEVETSRVIRPSAALAWRSRLPVIRKSRESVEGVDKSTAPEGK
jgi:hypothetical protein